jgi:uncharacterized protein (TIGR03435 family)
MNRLLFGVAGWLLIAGVMFGQPAKPLTFEVASVKPSPPDSQGMFVRPMPDGALRVTGASLRNLISLAYGVRWFQISGGPAWMAADCYDIDARPEASEDVPATDPPNMREEQRKINERLRSLLADRFQLTLHRETKEQPVYALVAAKGGPKLRESTDDRSQIRRSGPGMITGQAVALGMLALNLSNELGRSVIDKTGLTGRYSFELKWTPDRVSPPSDTGGPSIFTALSEQLGLRLESERGPVEVLVIDRVERPSKN